MRNLLQGGTIPLTFINYLTDALDKPIKINDKYLVLDPKPSDLTMIREIKARTGYRCNDIRRIVVSK